MATATTGTTAKEQYLRVYEEEHERTMKVLRAFPAEKAELRPHAKLKTARELAFIFALERRLATTVMRDGFADRTKSPGKFPETPATWDEVMQLVEQSHREFGEIVRGMPDEELNQTVKFMVAPRTLGDVRRIDFLWFIVHDEIHHRGQFSIYLRIADAKVPSIYGPSGDEPWM